MSKSVPLSDFGRAQPGDLIEENKFGYSHWMVYIGDDEVVEVGQGSTGKKEKDGYKIGTTWSYDLGEKNCEHFSKWCRYDIELCEQLAHANVEENGASVGLGKYEAGYASWKLPNAHIRFDEDEQKSVSMGVETSARVQSLKATVGPRIHGGLKHGKDGEYGVDAGVDLAKVSIGQIAAKVGPKANIGIIDDDGNGRAGVSAGIDVAQANIGRLNANVGLRADTGVVANDDNVGFQVLGTGVQIGRETKVSLFGMSLGWKF
uniref:LRAT domain-containing protein n=1 Tax=Acrobeloides nanus TaxID=290746 RepID=A0A914E0N7_9BILA